MCAAVDPAPRLQAMPDDLAPTVRTSGRHQMDRTLETVEHVHRALRVNLEGHLVVVATHLALRHGLHLPHPDRGGNQHRGGETRSAASRAAIPAPQTEYGGWFRRAMPTRVGQQRHQARRAEVVLR